MPDMGRIIAHIPARAGSKRVKLKNLRYLAGKPLLSFTVEAALRSEVLDQVYVNTDSNIIASLARELGAEVYMRPSHLASDTATSDQFNMDIIEALKPGTLVMINPVCPLIESNDIDLILSEYINSDADTLITVSSTQMQAFSENAPVNFKMNCQLELSQRNNLVNVCNWAITVWDANKYKKRYEKQGYAVFGDNRILFPISPIKSIKISTEEDFEFAELLMRCRNKTNQSSTVIEYWSE